MPKRAGFWIRVAATTMDVVACLIVYIAVLVAMLLLPAGKKASTDAVARAAVFVFYGTWLILSSLEWITPASLGKWILGLRILASDSSPADGWRRVLRWSTKSFPALTGILYALTQAPGFYLLTGFSSLFVVVGCLAVANDDKLAWHDRWAKTAVYWRKSLGPDPTPGGFPIATLEDHSKES